MVIQTKAQFRNAALAMGRRNDAFRGTEPCQDIGVLQCLVGKVINELLLDQLPGQGR
ncbi:hypothetical protein D3C84_838470 [compost metagenome]